MKRLTKGVGGSTWPEGNCLNRLKLDTKGISALTTTRRGRFPLFGISHSEMESNCSRRSQRRSPRTDGNKREINSSPALTMKMGSNGLILIMEIHLLNPHGFLNWAEIQIRQSELESLLWIGREEIQFFFRLIDL